MPRKRAIAAAMAVALAGFAAAARADPLDRPRPSGIDLPGIGLTDRRLAVDPTQAPWDAVAKVQTNIGTRCSGVLIGPKIVLTAAHCLYNRRTGALLQAGSVHVLFGYQRGTYRWHGLVASYVVGDGFDGAQPTRAQGSDWARLTLAAAVPATIVPLPLARQPPPPGTAVALAGYNQDRAQLLMVDRSCHIVASGRAPFLVHDCDGTRGTSGGPLLMPGAAGPVVVGINVAAGRSANLALAVSALR